MNRMTRIGRSGFWLLLLMLFINQQAFAQSSDEAQRADPPQTNPQQVDPPQADPQQIDNLIEQSGIKLEPIDILPLTNTLSSAKQALDNGEVDLTKLIELTITADCAADGSLTNINVRPGKITSPAKSVTQPKTRKGKPDRQPAASKQVQLLKEFAQALASSGALRFLRGAKQLQVFVRLDDATVGIDAAVEMKSAADATRLANGYSFLLVAGRIARRDYDEAAIYNATGIKARGANIDVKVQASRALVAKLLARKLAAS